MNGNKQARICAYARVATRGQITGMAVQGQRRRAYIYARVGGGSSSPPGTDFSYTMLEDQRRGLCECAASMGFEVAEQDVELARAGITESAVQKMLKAVNDGKVQAVMLSSCSRLHRDSEKVVDLLEELDHCGMRIYSQQEGWVNVSEEGQPSMLQLLQMMRSINRKEGALNALS